MLRTEDSRLRAIAVGPSFYTVRSFVFFEICEVLDAIFTFKGKWTLQEPGEKDKGSVLKFQVLSDAAEDRWQM